MRLSGLEPLYRDMRAQGMGRTKFHYQHNHLTFDCLFFIDLEPFELVMGCLGHAFAIYLTVQRGFEIRPFIEPPETFHALRKALFQNAASTHRFQAGEFFAEFNRHIPAHASPANVPTHHDVARICRDVEEGDKTHFCGWLDNTVQGNRVSAANLFKTRRMFGQKVHDLAKRRNQSTRWTDDPKRAQAFALPE